LWALVRLPLPHHTGRHAEPDADTGPGCTDGPARAETPVGSLWGDGNLSSRRASARWRYVLGLTACWSPASADLQGLHTSPPWWVEARRVAISVNMLIGTSPHLPGSRAGLLPPSPLRTARASFPACRSSLANAPCGTRSCHGEHLAVTPPSPYALGASGP